MKHVFSSIFGCVFLLCFFWLNSLPVYAVTCRCESTLRLESFVDQARTYCSSYGGTFNATDFSCVGETTQEQCDRANQELRDASGGLASCSSSGSGGTGTGAGGSGGTGAGGSGGTGAGGSGGTGAAPAATIPLYNPLGTEIGVAEFINRAIRAVIGFIGALALLMFIYGGVMWMTAGDSKRIDTAKQILKNSTIGLLLIFFSYSLVSVVFNVIGGS